jgi:hypothetical protein
MHRNRRKVIIGLVAAVVLVGVVAGGRHILSGTAASSPAASMATSGHVVSPSTTEEEAGSPAATHASAKALAPTNDVENPASPSSATETSGAAESSSSAKSAARPDVPTFALTPQIVHTATIDLRVGSGKLEAVIRSLTTLAGADGGYVNSSSVSGGTVRRRPVAGTVTFRVLASDFAGAITKVASLGTVEDQKINGQDVTIQVARNSASISVLKDEVSLLQNKLGEATDLGTFLQIQGQLFPVEQQLQQLQSAQAVLQNSASLATVTVDLTAPGAPVVPIPKAKPATDAATTAWRYLRHNSLAVLDGLAVGLGWALPVLVLLALVGLAALWVVRRRRHVVTPA